VPVDVWIAIVACLSGIWGVAVTFWAPDTRKKKLLCLLPFVVFAVVGVVLVLIQSAQRERAEKDNQEAQKILQQSVNNSAGEVVKLKQGLTVVKDIISGKDFDREKAAREIQSLLGDGLMQLQDVALRRDDSTFVAGGKIGVNVFVASTGQAPAMNGVIFGKAYIVGLDKERQDNKALKLFEADLASTAQQYESGAMRGQDISFGQGLWITTHTAPLTQEDCVRLLGGKANVYFFTWWAWTDSGGNKKTRSDCRSLQLSAPGQPYTKPEEVNWHSCVTTH
jgi:hypothetical protein